MGAFRLFKRIWTSRRQSREPLYPHSIGLTQCRILDDLRVSEPQTARMLAEAQPDVQTVDWHLPRMVEAGLLTRYKGRLKFGDTRRVWLYVRTPAARAYGHQGAAK